MRTDRFHCTDLSPGLVSLPPAESRHAASVLRVKAGREVILFDGKGREANAKVVRVSGREVQVEVETVVRHPFETYRRIALAVAMPRAHRQGFLIEKCTELGVETIWPVLAERSVTKPRKDAIGKWNRRAIEAAKQSGRKWVPVVERPETFEHWLERCDQFEAVAIANRGERTPLFGEFLETRPTARSVLVLVGPEGGWSDREVQLALDAGAVCVSLGEMILRTETAAVAACAVAVASGKRSDV